MPSDFLTILASLNISNAERAVALVWHAGIENHLTGVSVNEIVKTFDSAGYPKQNLSRLKTAIAKDRRTAKIKKDHYRINIKSREKLDGQYLQYVDFRPIKTTNSIVPIELYRGTRTYIEKVVAQLNSSYDSGLYDCCAVMCRRLLETLIIEVYETKGQATQLQNQDGNFYMFSGLKSVIENDGDISLSRNTKKGLDDFKKLGDLSAHSRRFNARKNDIDRIRDGLRVAGEELLHLAKLI